MKLHLGCGQLYLEGYINVDFSVSSHTVQKTAVADLHADITKLRYLSETVEEVRLHHVFEHFPRPVACALLASWYSWLKPQGIIHIEVPDFRRTARLVMNPFVSFKRQAVAERHLYGSHEADWAVHCEGYTPIILKKMIKSFGFTMSKMSRNSWRGIYNFEIIGVKSDKRISKNGFDAIAADYLKNYLLDNSNSEERLLKVWMDIYRKQIETSWAENG